jgi:hypothetical protein
MTDDEDVRILWVWHAEGPVDFTTIRIAKASLGLPYAVRPALAFPGTPHRVLAIGSRPPFLCDYALIGEHTEADRIAQAVGWVLGEREDENATTVLDMLLWIFGPGVREIPPEELRAEKRLEDYVLGRD